MPALVLCGRRWHTTTDMVCIPAGMGAFFHGIWVIIVAVESAHFQAWRVCPGSGPLFEIALGGLLAVFILSTLNQVVMTVVSLRGASRPRLPLCMHAPSRPVCTAKLVVLYGTMPVQLWPPRSPARPRATGVPMCLCATPRRRPAGSAQAALDYAGAVRADRAVVCDARLPGCADAACMFICMIARPARRRARRCQRRRPAGLSAGARAVLGTLLVARHDLACWHGDLRIEVFRLLQAMVISTWVFAGFFL